MDRGAYIEHMRVVAYLDGCAVREEVPDESMLEGLDLEQLLDAASRHTLGAVTACALQSAGVSTERVDQEVAIGLWKAAQLETNWQLVRRSMEAEGIWYCPLKGAVLKDLYPVPGTRQMADYDILFDASRAKDVRRIMETAGFSTEYYGMGNHDVYHKLPVSNFEMHRCLFGAGSEPGIVSYFQSVKDRLIKDKGNEYGWHMGVEECYLYIVSHEYKHFRSGGTGLRSLLDTYMYLLKYQNQMDWEAILSTADALGIAEFEEQQRSFALHLFRGERLSPAEEEFFFYIVTSGTYGTIQHRVSNEIGRRGGGVRGKLSYVTQRLFLPMESVKSGYPFFYRHKVLLPALVLYRLGRAAMFRRKEVGSELYHVWHHGEESVVS